MILAFGRPWIHEGVLLQGAREFLVTHVTFHEGL
jgi:hypothetical protein